MASQQQKGAKEKEKGPGMDTRRPTRRQRPSPTESATLFPEGATRRGNDGRMYAVTLTSAGVHRWAVVLQEGTGGGRRTPERARKTAARKAVAVPPEKDPPVLRRVRLSLALKVRHPFHSTCYAPHLDDADIDWRKCVERDAYRLLDAQQRALLADGLLHPHFHEYVREMVQYALEATRQPTLPRFNVRVEFPAGALTPPSPRRKTPPSLRCTCEVVFFDPPYRLDAAGLRKRLRAVLEHSNSSGGGYQGPSPKLAKEAQRWRREGKDVWSVKYTVVDAVCAVVPRSRYAQIVPAKRVKEVKKYRPRTVLDKLLGRPPAAAGTVQRVITYPSLGGREVFSGDITVEAHLSR